jgi:hypothetical protein
MTWVHVDTRYGRKYSCELQITRDALVYNHRSYPTVDVEYIQLDPEDETRLNVKFVGRHRPKAFFFISSDACEEAAASIVKVCEAAHKRTKEQAEEAVSFRVQHTSLSEAVTGVPAPTDVYAGPPPVTSALSLGGASIADSVSHLDQASHPDTPHDVHDAASHPDGVSHHDGISHTATSHPDGVSHQDTISHPDMADVASQHADDEHAHDYHPTLHSPAWTMTDGTAEASACGARPPREALLREVPNGEIPGSIPAKLLPARSRGPSRAASITPSRGDAQPSQPSLSRSTSFHLPHHTSPVLSMLRSTTHTFHFRQRGKSSASRPVAHPVSPVTKRAARLPTRPSVGRELSSCRKGDDEPSQPSRRGLSEAGGMVSFGGRSVSGLFDPEVEHPPGVVEHCLRDHPLEIFMFFTLMPIVFAAFWLSDAGRDMLDRTGAWIRASCTVHDPVTLVAEALHKHHAPHPGEEELTNGMVFVLERGWNVTVDAPPTRHAIAAATRAATPLHAVSDATGRLDSRAAVAAAAAARSAIYADSWMATAVQGLEPDPENECRGHLGESLVDLRGRCTEDGPWAPAIAAGEVRPCFVHRVGDSAVFLDVSEPWTFYADLGVSALCLVVAVASLLAVVRAQRRIARGGSKPLFELRSTSRAVLV